MTKSLCVRTTHCLVFAALLPGMLLAQSYEPPRMPDGRPDLTGTWSNASLTTLERHPRYESLFLDRDQVGAATAQHPQSVRLATDDNMVAGELPDGSDLPMGRGYNAFWIDPGTQFGVINGQHRTSWIVSPPNGRIPWSEEGKARLAMLREKNAGAEGPEARPLAERCLGTNMRVGPPMINGLYNNNYEIIQTGDHVVLRSEMISHARIVKLDAQHSRDTVRPWFGESVGHWNGDSLMVETTNFHPLQEETSIPLTSEGRVVERFTRVAHDKIIYEFTVEDPVYYTQMWYGEARFLKAEGKVYEFACHEGNYALGAILGGARREEIDAEFGRNRD